MVDFLSSRKILHWGLVGETWELGLGGGRCGGVTMFDVFESFMPLAPTNVLKMSSTLDQ